MRRLILLILLGELTIQIAWAQSVRDRIADIRAQREAASQTEQAPEPNIAARLADVVDPVSIDHATLQEALTWWSQTTDIPLVVNWQAMELQGVDLRTPITLHLRDVPAGWLLGMLMRQGSPDVPLLYEATPWYVELMTRQQANRQTVLRVYDVGDVLMEVPHFTNAPRFDLREIARSDASEGNQSLFEERDEQDAIRQQRMEAGEELVQAIRDTVEPDIWQANGGRYSSIRYHHGRLVVNAPLYVHRQIGPMSREPMRSNAPAVEYVSKATQATSPSAQRVSGVGPPTRPVAGVRE